jgi:endoglucanase
VFKSDFLKFTLPLSYSLNIVTWGAISWFDGYTKSNQVEYLRSMLRWGTDWLIQAHPDANTFYVQVSSHIKKRNSYFKSLAELMQG